MKTNKIAAILIVVGLIFTQGACSDDFLEREPISELAIEAALQTEEDVTALTNAGYDVLQWQVGGAGGANTHMFPVMWQDIRADNCVSQWATFWAFGLPLDDFNNIQPDNTNIEALWTKWYTVVARANTAIEFINSFAGFETEGLQNRLMAEAKFIRGFAYFEIVKMWGGGPLITEFIGSTEQDLLIPKATTAQIYAQVEQDLLDAATNLPLSYSDNDIGRATSGAAYALLAKVHLHQGEYDRTIEYTEEVISSNAYSLEPNYADNWNLGNEYGVESIFEIGYADGFTNFYFEDAGGNANQGSASYQMFGYIFANTGTFGNAVPRQELIDLYDASDTRLDASFIVPSTVYEENVQTCDCGAVNPDGSPNFDSDQSLWVGTDVYNFFWTNPVALRSRATMRKYDIPSTTANGLLQLSSSPLNEKVIRYADVLLMHAEASLSAPTTVQSGQASFDLVTNRALGTTGTDIPLTLAALKEERRKELATEGWDRFTDLVRWGDAATVLAFKNFTPGRDELLPIPQSEIDLVGREVLPQNDGY